MSAAHVGSLKHGLAGLGELLQPLAEVHRVADDRVLDPLLTAEQRRRHGARC